MQDEGPSAAAADEEAEGLHASLPPYAFRIETAKLLLDLDATTSAAEEVGNDSLDSSIQWQPLWWRLLFGLVHCYYPCSWMTTAVYALLRLGQSGDL